MMKRKVKSIAVTGVVLSVALILGVAESLLPPIFPALPFFRIGLSNVVVLFAAVTLSYFKTSVIVVAKSFLVPIFSMNPIMFVYSLPSAFLSFSFSFVLIKLKKLGLPSISFLSAILNNIVQVTVAALMTASSAVFFYLPYLIILGGLSGVLTGFIVSLLIKILPKEILNFDSTAANNFKH